jgi:TPR repeat protein
MLGVALTSLVLATAAAAAQAATADNRQDTVLSEFRRQAEGGDSAAMLALGQYYLGGLPLEGKPVEANPDEALHWLHRAAKSDNAQAACTLASYYRGLKDTALEFDWTQRAANGGAPACMYALGMRMLSGAGAKNRQQAFDWIKKAADAGFLPAQFQLGHLYLNGTGTPHDGDKAAAAFQSLAQRGVPAAMYYTCAMTGSVNKQAARDWCLKAAAAGNRMAMYQLGTIYLSGDGVPRDEVQARQWYIRAAALGEPDSMFWLGVMDEGGVGGPRNSIEAARWVIKALRGQSLQIDAMLRQPQNWSPAFWEALQTQLQQAGVYAGPIDGRLTQATLQAIVTVIKQSA